MSDLNPTSPSGAELTELKEQFAQLRAQTHNLRLALLMVALTLAGFFFVEVRRNGQALQSMRPQGFQVEEATRKQSPAISEFMNRLAEFGRSHPDFVPVLTKYGIPITATSAVPVVAPTVPKK